MLEDLITSIASMIPGSGGGETSLPLAALPLSYVCAIIGGLILSRFTGSIGAITVPLNCSALFLGTMLANSLFRGINLPMDHQLHQPLLISMIGMLAGAFAVLIWFHEDRAAPDHA